MKDDILKERCLYDPLSGEIVWKTSKGRAKQGESAVFFNKRGYGILKIRSNGKRHNFMAHRVAWFLHTGEWPKGVIDHIDNNPSNNAFDNLRDCSQSQNVARRRTKTREFARGVVYAPYLNKTNPYVVQLKCKHIGYFATPELASEAYELAFEEEYGTQWRN